MRRPSVAERIQHFNKGRDAKRLRLKYEAMRKGPFPFFRGTCHLFYEDWPTESPLNDGPLGWLCGDLHLENFGSYKGDNRLVYFDLNDFDEAVLAPCTWDVTRLATSALVGARSLTWSRAEARQLCEGLVGAYGDALAQGKARWVERETAQGLVGDLLEGLGKRTRVQLLNKLTAMRKGARKIRYGKRALRASADDRRKVEHLLRTFAAAQTDPRFFAVRHVANRIAGTGSLGVERYVILVEGKGSPDRNALLDVKLARPSALEPYSTATQPTWRTPAERVVVTQQWLQAASPALLQSVEIDGHSYVLRELQPLEDRLDLKASRGKVQRLHTAAQTMGRVTTPDFSEYYEQLALAMPDSSLAKGGLILLPYETSRGCWWGEKHHCTFCGLNAQTMEHREKSPDRVIGELHHLLEKHPTKKVCAVDNIMPRSYFRTLLPRLATEVPGLRAFYEQKSNLSLNHVLALTSAGICDIQPGIEALSTSLLKRMDKGVSARQNIALMRYARAAGLSLTWNLLYAFPGDQVEDYEQTLALVPLLRHLSPPGGLSHLSIDRFSPYFSFPSRYGITNVRPMTGYDSVLPATADVNKVAYHFIGDYRSASREKPELIARLKAEVDRWMSLWRMDDEALPALALTPLSTDSFLLFDSRGLEGSDQIQFIDREQASVTLAGRRLEERDSVVEWALKARLVAEIDSRFVPLATAEPEVLREFEMEQHGQARSTTRQALPVIQLAER